MDFSSIDLAIKHSVSQLALGLLFITAAVVVWGCVRFWMSERVWRSRMESIPNWRKP